MYDWENERLSIEDTKALKAQFDGHLRAILVGDRIGRCPAADRLCMVMFQRSAGRKGVTIAEVENPEIVDGETRKLFDKFAKRLLEKPGSIADERPAARDYGEAFIAWVQETRGYPSEPVRAAYKSLCEIRAMVDAMKTEMASG